MVLYHLITSRPWLQHFNNRRGGSLFGDELEISPTVHWKTGKTVLRGWIIFIIQEKTTTSLENNLEQSIKLLTNLYSDNPTEQTQFIIQQFKYENFQYSNKTGKYLANQLQRKKEKSIISSNNQLHRWNYPRPTGNE